MNINVDNAEIFFVFIGGLFVFFKGFMTLRKKRIIENLPTSKVRGLAVGLVELYGQAIPENTIKTGVEAWDREVESPLSKKRCIYYRVTIEKFKKTFDGVEKRQVHFDECRIPFYLKDETGKILINPKYAQINLEKTFYEESYLNKNSSAALKDYILKNKLNEEIGKSKIVCTEYALYTNQNIYIMGYAEPLEKVEKSDIGHENLTLKSKSNMFFIYDKSEKEIIRKLGVSVFYEIYGGAAASIIALMYLLLML
jgi:hypothetical protein